MALQKTILIILILISALAFALPMQIVQAQDVVFNLPSSDSTDITGFINSFYTSAVAIAGIAAVVMIVIGSIYYVLSRGSQDKQREGKDIITSAVWGVVLLLGAYTILNTVNPELVSLTPPGGPTPFCIGLDDPRDPCEPDEVSNPEGNNCCISQAVLVEKMTICPESLITECTPTVTIGAGVGSPYCEDESKTPSCMSLAGSLATPICGIAADPTTCDEGIPKCVDEVPVCATAESQIWISDCGNCNDEWKQWDSVNLATGAKYLKYVYYPRNGTTTTASPDGNGNPQGQGAECVVYAYQKVSGDDWEWKYADLKGLKKCF